MDMTDFSPTERRMLTLFADGRPHTRKEVHGCLHDDMGPISNIQVHISRIRKKLRPQGEDIVCELFDGRLHYRHIRLLKSPYGG